MNVSNTTESSRELKLIDVLFLQTGDPWFSWLKVPFLKFFLKISYQKLK